MQAALATQIVGAGLGAMGQMQAAKAEKAQAERNAFIGRTRAVQTATASAEGLVSELAEMRAALADNGQRGATELFRAVRATRDRERRVEFGNRMQEASDFRMQGANAMSRGRWSAIGTLASAAPSMFDLYQLRTRKNG